MTMEEIIHRKKVGGELSAEEIRWVIGQYMRDQIPDYQVAAFLMAVWFRGMSDEETVQLTHAMLESGRTLDLDSIQATKVDKHSTGGVGDKVSLVIAPLVAAAGVPVPMISGRALGHTGGTLDKLESIPGFRTDLTVEEFVRNVGDVGCCIMGQTDDLAPADGRLYALRDVTSTVDCLPLMASSIMSKKLAEGCDALVVDVKLGRGSFTPQLEEGIRLARLLGCVGRGAGKNVVALLTNMDEPLGQAVGNAIEVEEAVECLRGGGPADLREVTVALGAEMLVLGDVEEDPEAAKQKLQNLLDEGTGLEKMRQMVEAQGGDPRAIDDTALLSKAGDAVAVRADRDGFISAVDALEVGHLVGWLGAGRSRTDDEIDPAVGVKILKRRGDRVSRGESIAEIHASRPQMEEAARRLLEAFAFTDEPVEAQRLIRARVDGAGITVFG